MKELKNSKERGAAAVVIAKLRMREKEMREMLLARRQAVVRELRRELRRGLERPAQRGLDLVEEGGLSVEMEIGLTTASQRSDVLRQIDRTLRRLKEGICGICEDCGHTINIGRLKVMPFAIRCKVCQERWEASAVLTGTAWGLEVRQPA